MRAKPQIRNRYILFADLFLVIIAVLGCYALRLEMGAAYFFYLPSAYWMLVAALGWFMTAPFWMEHKATD